MVNGKWSRHLLLTIHHLPFTRQARVAQLDRAFDFESKGRRFEPCRAHHLLTKQSFRRLTGCQRTASRIILSQKSYARDHILGENGVSPSSRIRSALKYNRMVE